MVKHTKELSWKEHSVDLVALEAWMKANAGEHYCGNSADVSLKLHFLEEPSQETLDAIEAKWAELDDAEHEMCASYKSNAERLAEQAAKRESAKAKLAALGLSAEELKALLG